MTGTGTVESGAVAGGAPPRRRLAELPVAAAAHPVRTTALVGVVFVVLQLLWILRARHLGAFDVDEAGGLAASLRFHRGVGFDPQPLLSEVFGTYNGPLVPLLAVPLLVVGPNTVQTAMVVQSLLVVLAACSAAGMLASMGHRRAALLAGVAVMGASVSVVSSRSFQYSTGVGAFLALAMWMLLASDRGRSRWHLVGVGAATGAMLLCRTMSASLLPALGVAALVVVAWRERAVLQNMLLAVVATLVVAGPWWMVQWGQIMEYLVFNAYGDRAHYWGSVPISARLRDHWVYFIGDLRMQVVVVAAALMLALAATVSRRRRDVRSLVALRPVLAMWVVVALGSVALLSTSNRGFWFAYPLDVVFIAGTVAVLARFGLDGDRPWVRTTRDAIAVGWVAVVVATYAVSLDPTGPADPRTDRWSAAEQFIASLDRLQIGNVDADERLGSPDLAQRRLAAEQWQDANVALARELESLGEDAGPLLQSVTGEIHLFNANTILLAQEASSQGINALEVVNTLEPSDDELRRHTAPVDGDRARVLVIVDGRSLPFPDGRDIERFRRIAVDEGWTEHRRIPLPDGGEVLLYVHPGSIAPR